MSCSNSTDQPTSRSSPLRKIIRPPTLHFSHQDGSWILCSSLLGLTAVFLAIQSKYASNAPTWLSMPLPLALRPLTAVLIAGRKSKTECPTSLYLAPAERLLPPPGGVKTSLS